MNPKTMLRTTGIATFLLCAGPALAFAATPATNPAPGTSSALTAPAATSTAGTQTHMTESQVKSALKAEGYTDIEHLKMKDGQYTAEAERYGQKYDDLKIDASTGKVMNQQALNEGQVKDLLKNKGYSDISNVKQNGNEFTASAKKDGGTHNVTVDSQSGMVTPQAG